MTHEASDGLLTSPFQGLKAGDAKGLTEQSPGSRFHGCLAAIIAGDALHNPCLTGDVPRGRLDLKEFFRTSLKDTFSYCSTTPAANSPCRGMDKSP